MEICVVYLAWAGAGPAAVTRFAASVRAHPAGMDHSLLVAWKGFDASRALDEARQALAGIAHEELVIASAGLDLSSYRGVAEQVSADAICFLNTDSEILGDRWLDALSGHLSSPGVGLVGATGSYESQLTSAPWPLRILRAGRYPPFPNPHIRTNAFMLERQRLLALRWPETTRKSAAYELESGNDSITRQIEAQGLRALVVGRDGRGYDRDGWDDSRTFRASEQENLLVDDNRTQQYAQADGRTRRKLARLAWGQPAP